MGSAAEGAGDKLRDAKDAAGEKLRDAKDSVTGASKE